MLSWQPTVHRWCVVSERRSHCPLCFSKEKLLYEEETSKSRGAEDGDKEPSSCSSEEDEGEDEASESEPEPEAGNAVPSRRLTPRARRGARPASAASAPGATLRPDV